MNCRELLCISILVLCTTTSAAPPKVDTKIATSKWQQLANEPKFQQLQATLLSPDVMPFLSSCFNTNHSKSDEYSCNLYFDVVSWSQELQAYPNVTRDVVIKAIGPQPVEEFCPALIAKYEELSSKYGHNLPFDERSHSATVCIIACGDMSAKVRPPCATSLWLLNVLSSAAAAIKKADEAAGKKDLVNPLESVNAAIERENANRDQSPPLDLGDKQQTGKSKLPLQVPKEPGNSISSLENVAGNKITTTKAQQEDPLKSAPVTANRQDAKPSSQSESQIHKKPISSAVTPSAVEPGNVINSADELEPPIAGSKSTTDGSPAAVPRDGDKKDKQPLEPSLEGYDDDMESNENKDNQIDQMDELNEQDDNQIPKVGAPEIAQTQKMDQDIVLVDGFKEDSGSNFFFYFLFGMFIVIFAYVAYNNKSKIVALILEGRRSHGGRGGRRKHTAAYRKLDSNLEEAIMSAPSGRTTQVIY